MRQSFELMNGSKTLKFSTRRHWSQALSLLGFVTVIGGASLAHADGWTAANIQYLVGPDVSKDQPSFITDPDNPVSTFTFEVANGWSYGDNFFFTDVVNGPDFKTSKKIATYGEWHSRLSFSKISGKSISFGPISDVLLAAEVDYPSGFSPAMLYGPGFDLKIPGFAFFGLNLFVRDEIGKDGVGFQVSPYWLLPFNVGPVKMSFGGWFDFMTGEDKDEAWWQTQPTLFVDVGNFWGAPGKLDVGCEYEYFHNFLGIKDYTVNHPQFTVMWHL